MFSTRSFRGRNSAEPEMSRKLSQTTLTLSEKKEKEEEEEEEKEEGKIKTERKILQVGLEVTKHLTVS